MLVYQCARMADNCGECLALEPRFNCGWCESSGRCEVKDECAAPPWLDRSKPCPNPRVGASPAPPRTQSRALVRFCQLRLSSHQGQVVWNRALLNHQLIELAETTGVEKN